MGKRLFDVVVLGATGFTGNVVVKHLMRLGSHESISWAVAGRNENKLHSLQSLMKKNGRDASAFKVNVFDSKSVQSVTGKAKIVINCIGPYSKYGESVVESCLQTKTHLIDVSGEPLFLEKTQLKYNDKALKRETFVIGSCGFDSLPADVGFSLLRKECSDIQSVETFLEMKYTKRLLFNLGTWESLVFGYANYKELKKVRKQLFENLNFPTVKRKILRRINGKVTIPFVGSDRSVIKRTQYLNYKHFSIEPIPVETYFVSKSLPTLSMLVIMISFVKALSMSETGRSMLMKYPFWFSFGMTGGKLPTDEQLATASFEMRVSGHLLNGNHRTLLITGPEVGYNSAIICCIQSALTLLREQDKIPVPGGVLTPGFAFQNTRLIERLQQNGIHFKLLNEPN